MATKAKAQAAKQEPAYNPLRQGVDPRSEGEGNGQMWLKVEANSHADVACLVEIDEIISCEQCAIWVKDSKNSPVWVYTGPDDPSHELKTERRYRAYLPVVDKDGAVKVWSMGKTAHSQLLDIADATGTLKGMELRIKRAGAGLQTRYSIIQRGMRRDVSNVDEVDVIGLLGPLDPAGVRELIAKRLGYTDYNEVVSATNGKALTAKNKINNDEEEDLDDVELM